MAPQKDVEIKIGGDTTSAKASIAELQEFSKKELKQMSADADRESKEISDAFKKSGIRTESSIKKSSEEAKKNFLKIKNSGVASANDIRRAHNAMTQKIKRNNAELTAGAGRVSKAFGAIKKNFASIGVAAVGAGFAIKGAFDFASSGAKIEVQRKAFDNFAKSVGGNADELLKELNKVSRGTISTTNLIESAGKALLLGLNIEKIAELLQVARAASKLTGESIAKQFEDIATGTGRASKLILDNLGIQFSQAEATKRAAEALGIKASALTDVQIRTGNLNEVLRVSQSIIKGVGEDYDSNADSLARLSATTLNYIDELKILSLKVIPFVEVAFIRMRRSQLILQRSVFEFLPLLAKATDFLRITKNAAESNALAISDLNDEIEEQNKKLKVAEESLKNRNRIEKTVVKSTEDLTKATKEFKDVQDRDTASTHTQTTVFKTVGSGPLDRSFAGPPTVAAALNPVFNPEFVGPPTAIQKAILQGSPSSRARERFRRSLNSLGFAEGGALPGYGGGDRIPALLEAGEHIIRKESVRKMGRAAAEAFNRGDIASLIASLPKQNVRHYAEGGEVKAKSSVNVNLSLGEKNFAMTSEKSIADSLVQEIKNINIRHGRRVSPY